MAQWTESEVEKLKEIFYDYTRDELESEFPDRNYESIRRKAYRLDLERHNNIQRITSIENADKLDLSKVDDGFAKFVCGFVAGEGSFTQSERGSGTKRYRFCIQLARDDRDILYEIRERVFKCGSINEYEPRRSNEKGVVGYAINGFGEIVNRVIPFFDEYDFYSSRKQSQYNEWRLDVVDEIPDRKI